MSHTIREIAAALGAEAVGALDLQVSGAAEPAQAGPGQLALAMDPKYADGLAQGGARAAVLWSGADWQALGLQAAIFVTRPRLAMSGITRAFDPGPDIAPGVHPLAVIHATAQIGEGAAIGPFVTIGAGAVIGARARIASHVSIAEGVTLGADALIHAGARLCHRITIGARAIIHPGAVIGSDGFSFVTPEASGVEQIRGNLGERADYTAQKWVRIHSLGGVEIGDDVEIGANATIDRGTIRATRIGERCKLDNMVHVGHNVQIGSDCLLCGQVGIAGSSRLGNRVVLGGQCGVSDNIFVGDDVIAGGSSKLFTNVPAGRVILGSPAVRMEAQIEINKALRRLPRFMQTMTEWRKTVTGSVQKDDSGSEDR